MTARLPVRPIPITGESPAGVLMRAVEHNGFPSLQALTWAYMGKVGARGWVTASYVDPARFRQIIDALGIDYSAESLPAFGRAGPTSESARLLDGIDIPEKLFREDGRYYCPECLKEHKFWRKLWTLGPYSVCPRHKRLLLRDCTVCGKELLPWRGKLVTCSCGADLRDATSEPADPDTVEWWLRCHSGAGHDPALVDATLLAIGAVDCRGASPLEEYQRLQATHLWITEGRVSAYLAELVQQRSRSLHPRIQLLPMLRSERAAIRGLARATLRAWNPCAQELAAEKQGDLQSREASLALGISAIQLKKFKQQGLVSPPRGERGTRGKVGLESVNRLLYALQGNQTPGQSTELRPPTVSTATLALEILSGARQGAGYDIEQGLTTLRVVPEPRDDADKGVDEEWLDVTEIAAVLKTYPEAVRFVERSGWLPARHYDLRNRKRLIARRSDVEAFDRQYVFAGVLAKELNVNPTNLAEKLMELGARPVSGPTVDGALVYLFRRDEVARIDKNKLLFLKTYKTRAGRPPNSVRLTPSAKDTSVIAAADAAKAVGIGTQNIALLVKKKILVKADVRKRAVYLTRKSVDDLLHTLRRKDLISVEEAAARLGQKKSTFDSLWIKRKVLAVHELGLWRLVAVRDLVELAKFLDGKVTAAEAGRLTSTHRSHFPNLERRGAVRSVRLGKGAGIRLYDASQLEHANRITLTDRAHAGIEAVPVSPVDVCTGGAHD